MLYRILTPGMLVYRARPMRSESVANGAVIVTSYNEPCVVVLSDLKRHTVTVQNGAGQLEEVARAKVSNPMEEPTDADLDLQARVIGDLIRARRFVV